MGNEEGSAASFCHQLAALFPDMFCNFYFVKNHKIAKNSATIKDEIFLEFYVYVWTNLKTIKFYLIKLATDF